MLFEPQRNKSRMMGYVVQEIHGLRQTQSTSPGPQDPSCPAPSRHKQLMLMYVTVTLRVTGMQTGRSLSPRNRFGGAVEHRTSSSRGRSFLVQPLSESHGFPPGFHISQRPLPSSLCPGEQVTKIPGFLLLGNREDLQTETHVCRKNRPVPARGAVGFRHQVARREKIQREHSAQGLVKSSFNHLIQRPLT